MKKNQLKIQIKTQNSEKIWMWESYDKVPLMWKKSRIDVTMKRWWIDDVARWVKSKLPWPIALELDGFGWEVVLEGFHGEIWEIKVLWWWWVSRDREREIRV